jgi:hypothetical protein
MVVLQSFPGWIAASAEDNGWPAGRPWRRDAAWLEPGPWTGVGQARKNGSNWRAVQQLIERRQHESLTDSADPAQEEKSPEGPGRGSQAGEEAEEPEGAGSALKTLTRP